MPLFKDNPVLDAFRQMGRAFSRARARNTHGEVVKASDLEDSILKKLNARNSGANDILRRNWDSVIPQRFIGRCSFDNAKAAIVFARAQNAAVRQELQFEERAILKKINALQSCKTIKRIKFL